MPESTTERDTARAGSRSIAEWDAGEIAARTRAGDVSPVEIATHFLDRIQSCEPEIHAFVTVDRDDVMRQAEQLHAEHRRTPQAAGPLYGVPVAVKDQYHVRGVRTTSGSLLYGAVSEQDAACVERVRASGGIVLGKTNTPEFGLSWRTLNKVAEETRNPWDLDRSPGGSSGGSAAALASGMAPLAIGSDCAGSIRLPSAFCGTVGLLPSRGLVSKYGGIGESVHFTNVGPMARSVRDAALLLSVLAGEDPRDPVCLPGPRDDYLTHLDDLPTGVRLCWGEPVGMPEPDGRVVSAVRSAVEILASALGHGEVPAVEFGSIEHERGFATLNEAERYTLHGCGLLADARNAERLTPYAMERFVAGSRTLAVDYIAALRVRAGAINDLLRRLDGFDVVATPTVGMVAPEPLDSWTDRPDGLGTYARFVNYVGMAAISVPCGLVGGLPVGLQLVARRGDERRLLQVAAVAESITTSALGRLTPVPRP